MRAQVERMRSDMTLQELTAKKTGTAGKAPPSHGGFCYFQIRFCFNATSPPPPNFKSFFARSGGLAPGPSIWWSHRPKNLGCALLPGRLSPEPQLGVGYQQHQPGDAGRSGPAYHFAQLAFREFPPVPFTPSRQTSDSLVLLGISPGPPHQNHTVLSDAASWEAGNTRQA